MTTDTPTINACELCGGTGFESHGDGCTEFCPVCLEEMYCPRCGADNSSATYLDANAFEWAWDGETPCPTCGWKRDGHATNQD